MMIPFLGPRDGRGRSMMGSEQSDHTFDGIPLIYHEGC